MSAQAVLEARFDTKQSQPAIRRHNKELDQTSKKTSKLEKTLGRASKAFGGLAAVITGGASVQAAVSVYADFEQKMADLSAITGATGDDLKFLSDSARDFGASSKFSAGEAAEAFKLVASAKPDLLENGEALRAVTGEVLTLAAAAGIDLTDSAKTVGSALNQFGESADAAARFVNVLAAGSKFGASEVGDTAEALKFAGAVAKSAGLSFEQTNTAIQLLAGSGIKASSAGTGLRAVLARLEKQADQGIKPSVVGLEAALAELQKRNLTTADTFKMFGQVAAPAALALIANAEGFATLEEKITGTNTAAEQAATQMDTLNGDFLTMKSALQELAISFVETFGDDLRTLVQGSTSLIKGFVVVAKGVGLVWQGVKLAIQTVILAVSEAVGAIAEGVAWLLEKVGLISKESKESFSEVRKIFSDSIRIEMKKTADKMDDIVGVTKDSKEEFQKQGAAVKDVSKEIKTMGDEAASAAREQARAQKVTGDVIESMEKEIRTLEALANDYGITAAEVEAWQKVSGEAVATTEEFEEKLARVAATLENWREFTRQTENVKKFNQELDNQVIALAMQVKHFGESEEAIRLYTEASQNARVVDEETLRAMEDKVAAIERNRAALEELQAQDTTLTEIENLRSLRATLGLTEREQEKYNATMRLAGHVSEEFLDLLLQEIDLYHDKIDAMNTEEIERHWNTELLLLQQTESAMGTNEAAREKLRVSIELQGKATEGEIAQIHAAIDAYYTQAEALEAVRETYDFLKSAGRDFLKDFLEDGKIDFDDFLGHLKSRWVSTLADMATEKLVLNIQASLDSNNQGGASAGQFAGGLFGGQGLPGQGGNQAAGAAADAAGGGSGGGAAAGLAVSFFGGALGGYAGDERGTSESQLSGILNGTLTGAQYGGWVGAIVGFMAGAITSGFFDGTDFVDVGARMSIKITSGILDGVDRIRVQERDKPFLGGTERNEIIEPLFPHEYSFISDAFGLIRDVLVEGAEVLGLDTAEAVLDAFDRSFEVDVTGLDEDEAQAAVQEMLNGVFSELARDLLPFNDIFFRLGETWAETFERVVASVRASQEGLERIGVNIRGLISDQYVNETAELMVAQLNEAYFGEIEEILAARGQAIPRNQLDIDNEALAGTLAGERRIRELLALIDETSVTFEEALEIAVNRYQVALADAAGGPERLSELFKTFADTFLTTAEQMENALGFAIKNVQKDLTGLLTELGTTRDTFLDDFNAAQLEGIDPETFVQYLEAAELLGQLFELEVQLAAARGEAVQVGSLTAEQVRLLTEDSQQLVASFETLGKELGVSGDALNQFTLDLAAGVGSLEEVQSGLALIFSEFLTRGEQLENIMSQAGGEIERLGFSVEEFAAGGRDHFMALFDAAVALGDPVLIATLIELAPAVDAYLDALDELEGGVTDSERAISAAAATIKGLFADIGLVNPEDFGGLFGFAEGEFFDDLIAEFDNSGQAVDLFTLILREFFTESERAAMSLEHARSEIEGLGFDVDYLVSLGKEGFLELLRAASAAGDSELVANLVMAAPFFLELINAAEGAGGAVDGLGDDIDGAGTAAENAGQRFQNLQSSIAAAMNNVQSAIRSVLSTSSGLTRLGLGGASPNLQGRIDTLYGRRGQGTLESRIRNENELTGLITARYEAEASRIEQLMTAEQQRIDSINAGLQAKYQAELAAQQEALRGYQQMRNIARGLREFLRDLEGSPLGGATPFEAMLVAQRRFEEALKQARGGDQQALQSLQGFAQTYLEAAQSVFATSPEYFAIFDQVTSAIRDIVDNIEDQEPPLPPVPPQLVTIAENSAVMAGYQQQMRDLQAEAVAELENVQKELERLQQEAEAAEKAWREGLLTSNTDTSTTLTKMSGDNDQLLFMGSAANLSLFEIKSAVISSFDEIHASRILLHETKMAVRQMSGPLVLEISSQTQILQSLPATLSGAVESATRRSADRIVAAVNAVKNSVDSLGDLQGQGGEDETGEEDTVININEPTRTGRRNRSSLYGPNP